MPSELNGRSAGPDERERLERFLAWRRTERRGPESPGLEVSKGRLLPYVAAVAWLGLAILTGAAITTVAAGRTRYPPAGHDRGTAGAHYSPGRAYLLDPRTKDPERRAGLDAVTHARRAAGARPHADARDAHGRGRPCPVDDEGAGAGDGAVGKLKRWVGPEVRAGKAVIRWVKSQPAASQKSARAGALNRQRTAATAEAIRSRPAASGKVP